MQYDQGASRLEYRSRTFERVPIQMLVYLEIVLYDKSRIRYMPMIFQLRGDEQEECEMINWAVSLLVPIPSLPTSRFPRQPLELLVAPSHHL